MIIDYKTALNFIDTKFNNFLDFKYVNNLDCQYKWCNNNNNWKNHRFFSLHFQIIIKVKILAIGIIYVCGIIIIYLMKKIE